MLPRLSLPCGLSFLNVRKSFLPPASHLDLKGLVRCKPAHHRSQLLGLWSELMQARGGDKRGESY